MMLLFVWSMVILMCDLCHVEPFFVNENNFHHVIKQVSFNIDIGLANFNSFRYVCPCQKWASRLWTEKNFSALNASKHSWFENDKAEAVDLTVPLLLSRIWRIIDKLIRFLFYLKIHFSDSAFMKELNSETDSLACSQTFLMVSLDNPNSVTMSCMAPFFNCLFLDSSNSNIY